MPAVEFRPEERAATARLVELALAEDFGGGRDVTSDSLIPPDRTATVHVTARSAGVGLCPLGHLGGGPERPSAGRIRSVASRPRRLGPACGFGSGIGSTSCS